MSTEEDDLFRSLMSELDKGERIGRKLVYDRDSKTLRESSTFDDPDRTIKVIPEDMEVFSGMTDDREVIVISGELIRKISHSGGTADVSFASWDGGEVYNLFNTGDDSKGTTAGSIHVTDGGDGPSVSEIGKPSDRVRVMVRRDVETPKIPPEPGPISVQGYVRRGASWREVAAQVVPVKEEIFSRFGGLLETDVLASKKILLVGLGSGGSPIAMELVKSGIMNFFLVDHDRLEVANIARHVAGLSYVGRFKTKVMVDLIHEKNPYASVWTSEQKVCWEAAEEVKDIIRKVDVVVCATDNRPSKLLLNRLCLKEKKPCIFAGAFRRAYGGQVLSVKPGVSPCFQCFCMMLPEQAGDEEISSSEQAERLAYTDRPVPIEPGLSTDIGPISLMVAKLVIQEMLRGTETTLRSLDDDLVAPWYLWLNRREAGTQYENLEPMEFNIDGMHVLRWYGVSVDRHPGCPACGDFERYVASQAGIKAREMKKVVD